MDEAAEPDKRAMVSFRLVLGNVGEVVQDQQMILVQLGEGGLQSEIPPGNLKLLNQLGCSGEQNPPAIFHQSVAYSGRQVRLAAAGRDGNILPITRARMRRSTILFIHGAVNGSALSGAMTSAASRCWWSGSRTER